MVWPKHYPATNGKSDVYDKNTEEKANYRRECCFQCYQQRLKNDSMKLVKRRYIFQTVKMHPHVFFIFFRLVFKRGLKNHLA